MIGYDWETSHYKPKQQRQLGLYFYSSYWFRCSFLFISLLQFIYTRRSIIEEVCHQISLDLMLQVKWHSNLKLLIVLRTVPNSSSTKYPSLMPCWPCTVSSVGLSEIQQYFLNVLSTPEVFPPDWNILVSFTQCFSFYWLYCSIN